MSLKDIEAIIFDLDGTLWNATNVELKAINDVIKNEYNINLITIEQLRNVMGVPLHGAAEILFGKANKLQGIQILEKSGILLENYLNNCHQTLLYNKVKETLNALNTKYKLFIVSNCKKGYIETFLRTQKMINIFKDYECNGNTNLSKGDNIKLIINRNEINKAIYVGDTTSDKEAANYAKIPFIYASYGFGIVTEYDYKLNNIEDLKIVFD